MYLCFMALLHTKHKDKIRKYFAQPNIKVYTILILVGILFILFGCYLIKLGGY